MLWKFFNARWLNENRQSTVAVIFLDVASAYNVYIEYHVEAFFQLLFNRCFQCAVETVLVNFFVLQELVVGNPCLMVL